MRLADLTACWSARRASQSRSSAEPVDAELLELLDEASSVFSPTRR
jgi:hypothetical protein